MTTVRLLKYEGLGNDFLICLDPAGLPRDAVAGEAARAAFARFVCDRRRGLGADGLIVAEAPELGGDVAMNLRNSDGAPAETSGNGLRCLALCLVDEGLVKGSDVLVETVAGLRACAVRSAPVAGCAEVRAEVGDVVVGERDEPAAELPDSWRARRADTGNPHLVLFGGALEELDIEGVGRRLETAREGGQNVEAIAPAGGSLDLVVWERGAGRTQACGSGSVAAAAVARSLGLVGDTVEVHNPGGTLMVELAAHDGSLVAFLSGPACRIGRVDLTFDAGGVLS